MVTKHTKIGLWAALLALSTAACIDDQAQGINIRDVIDPEAPDCNIKADATTIRTSGVLDLLPIGSSSSSVSDTDTIPGYILPIRLVNNLIEEGDLQKIKINDDNMEYQVDTFRVNIVGYNVCLSQPQADDPYRHCQDIPEALSYFVPSAAYVAQGSYSVDALEVFTGKQLKDFLGDLTTLDYYGTNVVAHLTALGRMENGKTVESNEFLFPIKVCAGCRNIKCQSGYELDWEKACFSYQDATPGCKESDS